MRGMKGTTCSIKSDYIVGLADGEGCFYVHVYERDKRKYPRAHPQIKVHFYIKLRNDDLVVLKKLKQYLGFGFIYFQNEKRMNHSSCYRYEINSLIDWKKLIRFFDKHPLQSPKKQRDFLITKAVYEMLIKQEHFTDEGLMKIRQLKSQMHR